MMVDPADGGCWFCHTDREDGIYDEWYFSKEFDCFVHEFCVRHESKCVNREAQIMMKEFGWEE